MMCAGGFLAAPAAPTRSPKARRRKRVPRAVVRWRLDMSSGSRSKGRTLTNAPNDADGPGSWAAVAENLRRPLISQMAELTVADGKLTGKRQTEFGYDVIEAPLPAVVAVSDAINEPRYPSLKGIMGAKSKPQDTLSVQDIGLSPDVVGEAGSKTEVRSLTTPPSRGESKKIEDDGSAAQQIVDYLAEKRLL